MNINCRGFLWYVFLLARAICLRLRVKKRSYQDRVDHILAGPRSYQQSTYWSLKGLCRFCSSVLIPTQDVIISLRVEVMGDLSALFFLLSGLHADNHHCVMRLPRALILLTLDDSIGLPLSSSLTTRQDYCQVVQQNCSNMTFDAASARKFCEQRESSASYDLQQALLVRHSRHYKITHLTISTVICSIVTSALLRQECLPHTKDYCASTQI